MMRQRRRHSAHRTVTTGSNQQVNTPQRSARGQPRNRARPRGWSHQRLRVAVRREGTFQNLDMRRSAGLLGLYTTPTRAPHRWQGRQNAEGRTQFDSAAARFTAGTRTEAVRAATAETPREFTV